MDPSDNEQNHIRNLINDSRPELKLFEDIYRQLHKHPELSGQEEQTARIAARHLQSLDYEVHPHIGGHSVAGILRNREVPTTLLRADMDALPVEKKTNLPYASTRSVKNDDGTMTPVMHACRP